MSIVMQRVRLYVTTKDVKDAGTDSDVELYFYNDKYTNDYPKKKVGRSKTRTLVE